MTETDELQVSLLDSELSTRFLRLVALFLTEFTPPLLPEFCPRFAPDTSRKNFYINLDSASLLNTYIFKQIN